MRSLVVGASGGIGTALLGLLRQRGEAIGLSRRTDGLDLTDEASIARLFSGLDQGFDQIIVATGALVIGTDRPEKSLRTLDPAAMARQFAVNAIGPALVLKHSLRLLPKDQVSRFAVLSARVGSIGDNALGGWYSYRSAKAALNQFIHTGAIEVARTHPRAIVVCLHPGTVETGLTQDFAFGHRTVTPALAATNLLKVMGDLTPDQSGGFFDWAGKPIPW